MKKLSIVLIIVFFVVATGKAQTQELEVEATMDNSIYEEGALSNGAGDFLFTGVTKNNQRRRALVRFELTSVVPDGVTIDSSSLVLKPSKVKTGGTDVTVHKVQREWGEGTSDADGQEGKGVSATTDDATWSNAKFGVDLWTNPGGDYAAEPSAASKVNLGTDAVFMSSGLAGDVNSWLASPSENHGWIIIGDESTTSTAIRFYSRENSEIASRPTLRLYYQGSTSTLPLKSIDHDILVYQNNMEGSIVVRSPLNIGKCSIELFSMTGAKAFSGQVQLLEGETSVRTGIDKHGLYLYRIISKGVVKSGKLFIRGE
jgi:hypothetical protein